MIISLMAGGDYIRPPSQHESGTVDKTMKAASVERTESTGPIPARRRLEIVAPKQQSLTIDAGHERAMPPGLARKRGNLKLIFIPAPSTALRPGMIGFN